MTDYRRCIAIVSVTVAGIYVLDWCWKLIAVRRFFGLNGKQLVQPAPTVSLIQPITAGWTGLRKNLDARARIAWPSLVQHLLVCDSEDEDSLECCHEFLSAHAAVNGSIVSIERTASIRPATKTVKMASALTAAAGDVIVFIDDDVRLPVNAFYKLIAPLFDPDVGATFGTARYDRWDETCSSIMSLFVNVNALGTYIGLATLTEPFTITGHCFAIRRSVFESLPGLNNMELRLDDDHELARQVRAAGLRCTQTQLIYSVSNRLTTLTELWRQIKRWAVLPRQGMTPFLGSKDKLVSFVVILPSIAPSVLFALCCACPNTTTLLSLVLAEFTAFVGYLLCERIEIEGVTPWPSLLLLPAVTVAMPIAMLAANVGSTDVHWRGMHYSVSADANLEVLE